MRWLAAGIAFVLFASGGVAASEPSPRFADVPESHTFATDIDWLADQGITRGCNPPVNDLFCPDQVVTRGQMAAFLVRGLGLSEVDPELPVFVDSVDSMFLGDIMRLATAGITRGCNPPVNDLFCPDQVVTRGQMAAFLNRALPDALRIDLSGVGGATVGDTYQAELRAGGGFPPYSWSVTGLPAGLVIEGNEVTGAPTSAGVFSVLAQAVDSHGSKAEATVVIDVDDALAVTTTELSVWIVDQESSFSVEASGGETPYSWSGSGFPSGISIGAAGGISGTATVIDDHLVDVVVTDADGRQATSTLELRVVAPFYIETTSIADATVGEAYSSILAAVGGVPPLEWAGSGLPPGLSLGADGVVSGDPTVAGSSEFQATVTDSRGWVAEETLSIGVYDPLEIATSWLPDGTRTEPYGISLVATGGKGIHSWSGAMPSGLALATDGTISGTPSVSGSHGITVSVSDEGSRTDSTYLTIDIYDPLTFDGPSLSATVGQGYYEDVGLAGGKAPYNWSADLPSGFDIDGYGVIYGTPAASGDLVFEVSVSDSGGRSLSETYVVDVDDPLVLPFTSFPDAYLYDYYEEWLTAAGGEPPYWWSLGGMPSGIRHDSDGHLYGQPFRTGLTTALVALRDADDRSVLADVHIFIRGVSLVSVSAAGVQADDASTGGAISGDGTFLFFASSATNLVPGDPTWIQDIYRKNRLSGAIEEVTVRSDGVRANGGSFGPAPNADGDVVAFVTSATNLATDVSNMNFDIVVRDYVDDTFTSVSVANDGTQGDNHSYSPHISDDGRRIVFTTEATTLIPSDNNGAPDVLLFDRDTGLLSPLSVTPTGAAGNDYSQHARISGDGEWVVFESGASDLVPGDTDGETDIFMLNVETGDMSIITESHDGSSVDGWSGAAEVSRDGSVVVFVSSATNLVPGDSNGEADLFLYDRIQGTIERLAFLHDGGELDDSISGSLGISADGRFVYFSTRAKGVVPDDADLYYDAFVLDRNTGDVQILSVGPDGTNVGADVGPADISDDGAFVIMQSMSTELVPDDLNGTQDIFLAAVDTRPL